MGLDELGDRPHVMLDGTPRRGTVLTLSHWPATPSPPELAQDTSTEIALAYLERPEQWADARFATCDHLDEDGVLALFCVVEPAGARRHAPLLAAAARAGDFEVVESVEAGQVAWALRCLCDPARSPLAQRSRVERHAGTTWQALATAGALERLGGLLDAPARFEALWGEEAAAARAGEQALDSGTVGIERLGQADLAVVHAEGRPEANRASETNRASEASPFARIGHHGRLPVHPAVLHSRFEESRVLVHERRRHDRRRYWYYDRYESWVRYVSRRLPRRRDLAPLAERLSAVERAGARWAADPPGALVPVLRLAEDAESTLELDQVLTLLVEHLEQAPAAWPPFSGSAAPRGGTSGRGRPRRRGRRGAAPSA